MGKKKNFYDEYDELFVRGEDKSKSSLKTKKRGTELKPKAMPKPKPKPKKKAKAKKNKLDNKLKTAIGVMVCVIALVGYLGMKISESTWFDANSSDEPKEVYALKDAGIKATSEIDYSLPLAVTVTEDGLTFNRGYQLEIKGDWDYEDPEQDKAVLPSKEEYVSSNTVANLKFYEGRDYSRFVTIKISGNLPNSYSNWLNDRRDFFKAYPQEQIGDVMTGYVMEYNYYEDSPYGEICRYFVFPDGTGIEIRFSVDYEIELDLTSDSNFSEFKRVLADDYRFLSEDFIFSKTSAETTNTSNIEE